MGSFVEIIPSSEVLFPEAPWTDGADSEVGVRLFNLCNEDKIVFNIKTNNMSSFNVASTLGIIGPRSSATIMIQKKAGKYCGSNDKILIKVVRESRGAYFENANECSMQNSHHTVYCNLKCRDSADVEKLAPPSEETDSEGFTVSENISDSISNSEISFEDDDHSDEEQVANVIPSTLQDSIVLFTTGEICFSEITSSNVIRAENISEYDIAFNIRAKNAAYFLITPAKGHLNPGELMTIKIELIAPRCNLNDTFLLIFTRKNEGLSPEELDHRFRDLPSNLTIQFKYQCIWTIELLGRFEMYEDQEMGVNLKEQKEPETLASHYLKFKGGHFEAVKRDISIRFCIWTTVTILVAVILYAVKDHLNEYFMNCFDESE